MIHHGRTNRRRTEPEIRMKERRNTQSQATSSLSCVSTFSRGKRGKIGTVIRWKRSIAAAACELRNRRCSSKNSLDRPSCALRPLAIKQVTAEEEEEEEEEEERRFGVRGTMTTRKNRTDSNRLQQPVESDVRGRARPGQARGPSFLLSRRSRRAGGVIPARGLINTFTNYV